MEGERNISFSSTSSGEQQEQDIAVIVTARSWSKRNLGDSIHCQQVKFSIKYLTVDEGASMNVHCTGSFDGFS